MFKFKISRVKIFDTESKSGWTNTTNIEMWKINRYHIIWTRSPLPKIQFSTNFDFTNELKIPRNFLRHFSYPSAILQPRRWQNTSVNLRHTVINFDSKYVQKRILIELSFSNLQNFFQIWKFLADFFMLAEFSGHFSEVKKSVQMTLNDLWPQGCRVICTWFLHSYTVSSEMDKVSQFFLFFKITII